MPLIPRAAEAVRTTVSTPVPIGSSTQARNEGEAIAGLGKQIQNFAEQQLEFDRSLKRHEVSKEIQNIQSQADTIAKQNAREDGSDYGQIFKQYSEPLIKQVIEEKGTDPRLRREFQSMYQQANQVAETNIIMNQAEMLESSNLNRLEKSGDTSADLVRQVPDENMLTAEFKSQGSLINKAVESGGLSAKNAIKARDVNYNKLAKAYVNGLEDRKLYGKALSFLSANQENEDLVSEMEPSQARALGFIDSREEKALAEKGETFKVPVLTKGDKVKLSAELGAVASRLTPREKDAMIDRLKAKAQEATQIRLADLNAQIQGFERVALSGGSYTDKQVGQLKEQINMAPNMTLQAKKRAMDAINSADAINSQVKLAGNTPRGKWEALLANADKQISLSSQEAALVDPKMGDVDGDFAVQARRSEHKEVLQRSLVALQKQQDKDAARFVLENDGDIEMLYRGTKDNDPQGTDKYVRTSLAKQNYLGIPPEKQRILTREEAVGLAQSFKALTDSQMTSGLIDNLQTKYGSHFPRIMKEIVAADKDLDGYEVAAYAPLETRTALVDAIRNEGDIKKAISSDPHLKAKKASVNLESNRVMSGFRKALSGSGNDISRLGIANTLQKQVELQVQRAIVKDPDADVTAETEKAYQAIVGSTYEVISARNSTVIVPRTVGGRPMDTKIVDSFIGVYSSADNFSDLEVAVPKTYDDPKKFYFELQRSHRWVTNEDQSGLRLMQMRPDGRMMPVYTKYKKPVEKTFEDINLRPGKKVLDANKGFLGRLFD